MALEVVVSEESVNINLWMPVVRLIEGYLTCG
jgi:hypothetical protein